jgi:hypothetical protein
MPATLSANRDGSLTVCLTFHPGTSMMESETNLQAALNEAGSMATGRCLERFDTDGLPLQMGGQKWTSKGCLPKTYQTPYGEVEIQRHVYQTAQGGDTFCPLEGAARIVRTATPLFARQVGHKFGHMNSTAAEADLLQHGRVIARSYLQTLAADVASIALEKEPAWSYLPLAAAGETVRTISFGVDGTCALFCEEGYKQVMVGTIALYNPEGERLSTVNVAAVPEAGKAAFLAKMDREVAQMTARFPQAQVVAIADGAHDHWPWLEARSLWQVVDFWHVSEYLAAAAVAMARGAAAQELWLAESCSRLKHESGAAAALLAEMEAAQVGAKGSARQALDKAISYFRNHQGRMNYALHEAMHLPIGSGVTEAACKSVVKERMCGSGMKWTSFGAQHLLALRTLLKSDERWAQFWDKITQFGFCQLAAPHPARQGLTPR